MQKNKNNKEIKKEVNNQINTHTNQNSSKGCNKEQVHLCKDYSEQEVKTKRGGWPVSPGGGLKGGARPGV